jgi:adhesin transport system membrane fusion protein
MLNISENSLQELKLDQECNCFGKIQKLKVSKKLVYWMLGFLILSFIVSLLPWTQNISAKGKVTTIRPEHRPQAIYPVISGRIAQWYVQEGDTIQAGDTLARITEVKTEYFDPNLLGRTDDQVKAKEFAVKSYEQKAGALEQQLSALDKALKLKLEQAENKVEQAKLKIISDSMDFEAAIISFKNATNLFLRTDTLYNKGLKSLTEWQAKQNKMQEAKAKEISAANKLLLARNELMNARIELNSIRMDYANKIAKSRSDRYATLSNLYDAESTLSKLKITQTSYEARSQFYYITAPQGGIISKIFKKGLGELIKDTEKLMSVMPHDAEMAVELFVRPMDYALLKVGEQVIFTFDGWPAFVFSGWPDQSVGTFRGRVFALDNVINEKNQFRVLVKPDETFDKPWPPELRVGAAANGQILLKDVPLWYEIWRQLNGFPPEYYDLEVEEVKLKAPAEHMKK